MSAPPIRTSTIVLERLERLGVAGPMAYQFLAWCQRAGYLDPITRYSDRDLAGRVAEFATAADRASVTLARPYRPAPAAPPAPAPVPTRPEPAEVLCWFPGPVPTPAIVRRETHR
jgi:hypothetical protein